MILKNCFLAYVGFIIFVPLLSFSQTINTGYSEVFIIGTGTESHPIATSYSSIFEMGTFGDGFSDFSELFELNTIGGYIYGQITDAQSGFPIEGAILKTLEFESIPSDNNGMYEFHLPHGYGYGLAILVENYETQYFIPVDIPESDPVREINVQMVYTPLQLEITEIAPNPNPGISIAQQGGSLHRHYKVFNNYNGNPVIVPVNVIGTNGFSDYFISKGDGIVDIKINSSDIGSGQAGSSEIFSIVQVGIEQLTEPIEFTCTVENVSYEKYWDNYGYVKLGGNFAGLDLSAEIERGAVTSVVSTELFPANIEHLNISRQGRAGIGVGFKVKAPGVSGALGPVQGGVGAEAGLGAKFMGITEDNYRFNYVSASNWEAVAKYILIADGNYGSIDNAMIRILSLFEEKFSSTSTLEDAFVSDGVGIDVVYEASAEAFAGVEVAQNAKVGLGANVGTEAHLTFQAFNHHIQNELEFNFGVSGKFAAGAGMGLKMDLVDDPDDDDELSAMLNIWDTESSRGLQFSTFINVNAPNTLKRFELKFIKRNFLSKYEEEILFSIEGQEVLGAIETLTAEIQEIRNSYNSSTNITVKNNTFKLILQKVFEAIYNVQASPAGEASIAYQKDLTKISHSTSFDVGLDLSATVLALEVGGGIGFEQGKKMTVESGKWVYGRKYANRAFTSEIPNVPVSYQQVLQEIVDDVPWWLRLLIATIDVIIPGKKDATYFIGDNGSYIVFPDNAFPTGLDSLHCSSWSWYGDAPSKKLNEINENKKFIYKQNKKDAEEAFGMIYGIGGFYQFEPYETALPDTAWLTIVYDQAEVDSLDESSLGMYWEDKSNHIWKYIGGVLDTLNNTVSAPVTDLSLFTLAPAMPFGTFGLNATPDTIYADSISVATIISDTLYYNNLKPVHDSNLYTVTTNYGHIISPDFNTLIDGVQIYSQGHKLQYQVLSNHIAGTAKVSAYSVNGSAYGTTQICFYDTIAPAAPSIIGVVGGYANAEVTWHLNTEADIAGYKLYFDTETELPLEGIHTVYGDPSPIITGIDTTKITYGLFNDSTYYFAVSAFDVSGNESELSTFVSTTLQSNSIAVKVFLEGSFNGIDEMRTDLNDFGILPLSQPFNLEPWYYSGSESVAFIPNSDIVDWILLEFRDTPGDVTTATSAKTISRKAAFLLKDGTIVERDGISPVSIPVAINDNLYVAVWHRNHLGVISANPLAESGGVYNYDFTIDESLVYGSNTTKELSNGIWGMLAADGNADGMIDNLDLDNIWSPQAGDSGYKSGDFNLDTQVDNKDKDDVLLPNDGKGSQIPN